MSERTHEPTAQRLREARREGRAPSSRLFLASASTAGGLVGLLLTFDEVASSLAGCARAALSLERAEPLAALEHAGRVWAKAGIGPLVGASLGALAAALALVGFRLELGTLLPKLERLDPLSAARRMLALKTLTDGAKAGLAAATVLVVTVAALWEALPSAIGSTKVQSSAALAAVLPVVGAAASRGVVVLLLLGVVDLTLAHLRYRRELRMSREEVRAEHKNSEGDPATKSRRQAVHRQLVLGGPARGVARATTVVVNPTHIAIALRYDARECDAPYLVEKATADAARALKARAFELGIPVVRDVPLARALLQAEVGECIPEELYVAAAAVLRVALDATGDAQPHKEPTP